MIDDPVTQILRRQAVVAASIAPGVTTVAVCNPHRSGATAHDHHRPRCRTRPVDELMLGDFE